MKFYELWWYFTCFDSIWPSKLGIFYMIKAWNIEDSPNKHWHFSIAKVHMYVDFKNWTKQAMMVFLTQFHYEIWGFTYIIREILGLQPHKSVRIRNSDVANIRIYTPKTRVFHHEPTKTRILRRFHGHFGVAQPDLLLMSPAPWESWETSAAFRRAMEKPLEILAWGVWDREDRDLFLWRFQHTIQILSKNGPRTNGTQR